MCDDGHELPGKAPGDPAIKSAWGDPWRIDGVWGDPRNTEVPDDLECRTREEWDAKYGRAQMNGRFKIGGYQWVVLVSEIELIDGKIVAATGVDGYRYAYVEHPKRLSDGRPVCMLISDPNQMRGWPYPPRLAEEE